MRQTLTLKAVRLLSLAGVVAALCAGPASAAAVFVAHGIPGDDLGQPTALPVDVSVNGECLLTDFSFGDFAGPVELPRGDYAFEVRLADGDCTGALAARLETHTRDRDLTIAAHLDETGAPVLSPFVNDDSALRDGFSRVFVRHAAAAPAVDVTVERGKRQLALFDGFANADQRRIALDARKWKFNIFPAGADAKVAGPVRLRVPEGQSVYVYAVGSLENATFQLLVQSVDLP